MTRIREEEESFDYIVLQKFSELLLTVFLCYLPVSVVKMMIMLVSCGQNFKMQSFPLCWTKYELHLLSGGQESLMLTDLRKLDVYCICCMVCLIDSVIWCIMVS